MKKTANPKRKVGKGKKIVSALEEGRDPIVPIVVTNPNGGVTIVKKNKAKTIKNK